MTHWSATRRGAGLGLALWLLAGEAFAENNQKFYLGLGGGVNQLKISVPAGSISSGTTSYSGTYTGKPTGIRLVGAWRPTPRFGIFFDSTFSTLSQITGSSVLDVKTDFDVLAIGPRLFFLDGWLQLGVAIGSARTKWYLEIYGVPFDLDKKSYLCVGPNLSLDVRIVPMLSLGADVVYRYIASKPAGSSLEYSGMLKVWFGS